MTVTGRRPAACAGLPEGPPWEMERNSGRSHLTVMTAFLCSWGGACRHVIKEGKTGAGVCWSWPGDGERASLMMPTFCLNMDSNVWPSGASPSVLIGLATGDVQGFGDLREALGVGGIFREQGLYPGCAQLLQRGGQLGGIAFVFTAHPWMLMLRKPNSLQKWFMAACPVTRMRSASGMSASSFLAQEESWSIFLFHRASPAL